MGLFTNISLRLKIPLLVILIVLVVFSLAGYFSLRHIFNITTESYKRELFSVARLLYLSYTQTGFLPLEELAASYSVYFLEEEEEGFLRIVDTYNADAGELRKFLFQFRFEGKEKVGLLPTDELLRIFKTPLGSYFRAGKSMVIITVPGETFKHLEGSIRRDFILLYLLGILLALIGSLIFSTALKNRLKKVSGVATELSLGRIEKRVEPIGSDEIGMIARMLNSFADEVQVIDRERAEFEQVVQLVEFPIAIILKDGSLLVTNSSFRELFGEEKGKFYTIVEGLEGIEGSKLSLVLRDKKEITWLDKGATFHLVRLGNGTERVLFYGTRGGTGETDLALLGIDSIKLAEKLHGFIKIISSSAQAIPSLEDRGKIAEKVEDIQGATGKIRTLLNLLQEYVAPRRPSLEATELKSIVDEILADLPEGNLLKINVEVQPDLKAFTSPPLLKRAIYLLIDNALYAVKRGGEIFLRAAGDDETVSLVIADTGQGMDEKVLAQSFEPFFSTWGRPGLGLTLARKLVESQGGRLKLSSSQGGTQATIILKRARG